MRRFQSIAPAIAAILVLSAVAATAAEPVLIRDFGDLLPTTMGHGRNSGGAFFYRQE